MMVYPVKTLAVFGSLILIWPKVKREISPVLDLNAVLAGMAAFILWVALEDHYPPWAVLKA